MNDSLLDQLLCFVSDAAARLISRRNRRYHDAHSNSLEEDQAYPVAGSLDSVSVDIAERLDIPGGDGVFLHLDLRTTRWGSLSDPYVELHSKRGQVRQYLERGVSARRYINVSTLAGSEATLSLHALALGSRQSHFLVSPSRVHEEPLLVVAPHPDDAELSSFGLYSSRDSWVVTVCAGEGGTHDYGGLFTHDVSGSRLRGKLRVGASLAAPIAGNVRPERCANLGYFDDTLAVMHADRASGARSLSADTSDPSFFRRGGAEVALPSRGSATWEGLVEDIVHLLTVSRAKTVTFPHPILDGHRDHQLVGLAVMEALERFPQPVSALSYVVHGVGGKGSVNIHPVGNRDGTVSLQPLQAKEPLFDAIVNVPLTEEQSRRKVLALDHYSDIKSAEGPLPPEDALALAKRGLREIYRACVVYDLTLMRRFARPNEIFYILDTDKIRTWRSFFESGAGAQQHGS